MKPLARPSRVAPRAPSSLRPANAATGATACQDMRILPCGGRLPLSLALPLRAPWCVSNPAAAAARARVLAHGRPPSAQGPPSAVRGSESDSSPTREMPTAQAHPHAHRTASKHEQTPHARARSRAHAPAPRKPTPTPTPTRTRAHRHLTARLHTTGRRNGAFASRSPKSKARDCTVDALRVRAAREHTW